jgi:hypothetical protein
VTPPSAVAAPVAPPRRTRSAAARPQVGAGNRAPRRVPRPPRRISGPARGRGAPSSRSRSEAGAALVRDPLAGLRRLTPGALAQPGALVAWLRSLQRLLSGRLGIALVAFALIGIVTLQLGLLKLNGGIGRALEHEALLQRENAALSIENSELAASDRVELRAAQIGMQYVAPGALKPLAASPGADALRAATALRSPPLASTLGGAVSEAGSGQATSAGGAEPASGSAASSSSAGEPTPGASAARQPASEAPAGAGEGAQAQSSPTSQGAEGAGSARAPESSGAPAAGAPAEAGSAGGTASSAGAAG